MNKGKKCTWALTYVNVSTEKKGLFLYFFFLLTGSYPEGQISRIFTETGLVSDKSEHETRFTLPRGG